MIKQPYRHLPDSAGLFEDAYPTVAEAITRGKNEISRLRADWQTHRKLVLKSNPKALTMEPGVLSRLSEILAQSHKIGREVPLFFVVRNGHFLEVAAGVPGKEREVSLRWDDRDFRRLTQLASKTGGNVAFGHTHPPDTGPIFSAGSSENKVFGDDHDWAMWQQANKFSHYHVITGINPRTGKPTIGIWRGGEKGVAIIHPWRQEIKKRVLHDSAYDATLSGTSHGF